ncbi:hypothetical protein CHS0354_016547 [Potamilus streckersoni]|uniref:Uncharacterized protein n=1 Tax=Potamilus streckersoni TaxID=2493646 RepID=A0AAE0TKU2_9BIVA|nr:hypothetical protein CHS0354_016547 [Potamilus streckersoni]
MVYCRKGSAPTLLNDLDEFQRRDYDKLVFALNTRDGSVNTTEMYRAQLQTRVRDRYESLPELAQSIKKLIMRQAYPGAISSITDIHSFDHFIDDIAESLSDPKGESVNEITCGLLHKEFVSFKQEMGNLVKEIRNVANPNKLNKQFYRDRNNSKSKSRRLSGKQYLEMA